MIGDIVCMSSVLKIDYLGPTKYSNSWIENIEIILLNSKEKKNNCNLFDKFRHATKVPCLDAKQTPLTTGVHLISALRMEPGITWLQTELQKILILNAAVLVLSLTLASFSSASLPWHAVTWCDHWRTGHRDVRRGLDQLGKKKKKMQS